jgi:hypothetical protein
LLPQAAWTLPGDMEASATVAMAGQDNQVRFHILMPTKDLDAWILR